MIMIKVLNVGAFDVNCILLWESQISNPKSQNPAVVIDPGADADAIEGALRENGLTLSEIWLTHGHIDHISATMDLLKGLSAPVPVRIHAADAAWAFTPFNRFPPYRPMTGKPQNLSLVEEGTLLKAGAIEVKVLHTPGHSPGSVCYHLESESVTLTGDTLFRRSVGRADLYGGDMGALRKSLKRLATLPEGTRVIPGHGPETTIADEKRFNPYL